SVLHVNFTVHEICNNVLRSVWNCLRYRPSCSIVHCCNNPPIPLCCLWKDSNQVDPPTLEWLNKRICHHLSMFLLLINSLALRYLAVWTSRNEPSHIRLQCRPPASSFNRISNAGIGKMTKLTMQLFHKIFTEERFNIGRR